MGTQSIYSSEQQERRSRERFRPSAVIKAALVAGLITYILPGGGPWMSFDTGIATMGRVVTTSLVFAGLLHLGFALAYGAAIALVIYSLPLLTAIIVGALCSIPLYGLNYLILSSGLGCGGNEVHAVIAHFMFCLLFSATYRGFAIPRVPSGAW